MKKILNILMMAAIMVALVSCDNTDDELMQSSQLVRVSLNPSFSSGNITRGNGDLYTKIYNKIIDRELVAGSYSLVFTDVATNKSYSFNGIWGSTILIKSGRYKVTGSSTATGEVIQDKCSMRFDTEIDIKPTHTNIALPAEYDCFLLLFDKSVIKDVTVFYGLNSSKVQEMHLFNYDDAIYCFSKKLYNENVSVFQFMVIDYADNSSEKIVTPEKTFDIGKYYLWNGNNYSSVKSSFLLPKMNQGNI